MVGRVSEGAETASDAGQAGGRAAPGPRDPRRLFFLACDHRGAFQELFGVGERPGAAGTDRVAAGKEAVLEGALRVAADDSDLAPGEVGVLVDEQFGTPRDLPARARAAGLRLAVPAERSGRARFEFEHGDDFPAHIRRLDPDFTKVLVRLNPEGDAAGNRVQLERLRRLSDWLGAERRGLLFELLVPAEPHQLAAAGGDVARYDADLRPSLMLEAVRRVQDAGIEADVWKVEGVEARADAEALVRQMRHGARREDVRCILLGRGAGDEDVERWLRAAAPVDGVAGFAIGRGIWGPPLRALLDGRLTRDEAVADVAARFRRPIAAFRAAAAGALQGAS